MNTLNLIQAGIKQLSLSELNQLSSFINDVKVINAKASLIVGQKVNVVKKTKKTPGGITKIKQSKCLVDMSGRIYSVPMSMLEAA